MGSLSDTGFFKVISDATSAIVAAAAQAAEAAKIKASEATLPDPSPVLIGNLKRLSETQAISEDLRHIMIAMITDSETFAQRNANNPQATWNATAQTFIDNVIVLSPGVQMPKLDPVPLSPHAEQVYLQTEAEQCKANLDSISATLNDTTIQNANDTVSSLVVAVTSMDDVAVFIRGDYDNRNEDETAKKNLLAQTVSKFQDADAKAETALATQSNTHSIIVNLHATMLIPLHQKVKDFENSNQEQIGILDEQIKTQSEAVANQQKALQNAQSSLQSAESNLSDAEKNAAIEDGVLDVFTFGHGSSVDIMGFHNQVNQAKGNMESAMKTMQASRTQLQQFQTTRRELTSREAAQKQIQDQLPGLDSNTQALMTRSVALQKQLADLKDASSQMVVKVRDIQNKATLASQLAFTKKEFVSGLLDVCEAALIDLKLLQPVKKITDEISTGYTGNMPDDVKQQIDAVEAKRQTVGNDSIVALSI